ncbi:MAG TPA: hypothetical protein VEB42_11885 [Chitinophagaceae bacterium]|nr:hypothetical protein [Chitinophagaceae bacterium]
MEKTGAGTYRYGFNGQEKSIEIKGEGNHNTAEYWEYDTRLGKRWNPDPVIKYHESPYAAFANNPIWFSDPLGADTISFTKSSWSGPEPKQTLDNYKPKRPGGTSFGINVRVAEGDDVFYYTETHTDYNADGTATTTSNTQQFDPVKDHKNGVTETSYMFGLLTYKDNDRLTLAKFAPKELLNYLINKSDGWTRLAYMDAKALQPSYTLFKGLQAIEEAAVSYYGFSLGMRALSSLRTAGSGELFNFTQTTLAHMGNPGRRVPVQILDDVIKNSKAFPDPQGTNALMYYERLYRNGKAYNFEVLYDKTTNTILHFQYGRKAMGPLQAIPK